MTWEILDIERGDVLAEYDSQDAAETRLRAFLEEHPERMDELAIAIFDDEGEPVGEQISGASLIDHSHA